MTAPKQVVYHPARRDFPDLT
ncbi:MAG: hypothetical protein RIQ53_3874, partial [Pseudomonadota bacterium]